MAMALQCDAERGGAMQQKANMCAETARLQKKRAVQYDTVKGGKCSNSAVLQLCSTGVLLTTSKSTKTLMAPDRQVRV